MGASRRRDRDWVLEAAVCVAEVGGGVRSQAHAGGATVGRLGKRGWLEEVERNFCWGTLLSARSGCELGGFGPPVVGFGGDGRGE